MEWEPAGTKSLRCTCCCPRMEASPTIPCTEVWFLKICEVSQRPTAPDDHYKPKKKNSVVFVFEKRYMRGLMWDFVTQHPAIIKILGFYHKLLSFLPCQTFDSLFQRSSTTPLRPLLLEFFENLDLEAVETMLKTKEKLSGPPWSSTLIPDFPEVFWEVATFFRGRSDNFRV